MLNFSPIAPTRPDQTRRGQTEDAAGQAANKQAGTITHITFIISTRHPADPHPQEARTQNGYTEKRFTVVQEMINHVNKL